MREPTRRAGLTLLTGSALAVSLIALAAADEAVPLPAGAQGLPLLSTARKHAQPAELEGFDPRRHRVEGDRMWSELPDGARAQLTLDPGLQQHLEDLLARYQVPYGAVAALEPRSGRMLAYVSHSSANPRAGDLVRDASPPAASVFKVVTASALVDAGIGAGTRVCYNGGFRSLSLSNLVDNPARDRSCATLADAMGGSINSIFAKLADKHLDPARLRRYADAFGFGEALPFDVRTQSSALEVPAERVEFARTAAGFWHMHMSPLHASLIAATVANGGSMPRASMVERVLDEDGKVVHRHKPETFRSVIPRATARSVAGMMKRTISHGTAHGAFFDQHGNAFLPGIQVAGKTGSLSEERPYRAYSWWVGFAPADKPEIAVAALVVNEPRWRIKGSFVGREALRQYLVERPRQQAAAARAAEVAAAREAEAAAPAQAGAKPETAPAAASSVGELAGGG